MRISNRIKMSVLFAVVAAIAFGAASVLAVQKFADNVQTDERSALEASLDTYVLEVNFYVDSITNDLKLVASAAGTPRIFREFSDAFTQLGTDPGREAQRLYIAQNPHPRGSRQSLVRANDGSKYSEVHGRHHRWFVGFAERRDYYDVFCVDADGNVVYTVFKEADFGTNLLTGPFKDTLLAKTFRDAMKATPGTVVASGFERYAPSNYIPAAFQGIPVYENGEPIGALILQLRIDRFNKGTQISNDLGPTFEAYFVNDIRLMMTDSRFVENAILSQGADTESVRRALAGASGFHISTNYRGDRVLSAYRPFVWAGGHWAAIAEVGAADLEDRVAALARFLGLIGAVCTVVAAGLGWLLAAKD